MPYKVVNFVSNWRGNDDSKLITLNPGGGREFNVALIRDFGVGYYEGSPRNGMAQRDGVILERNDRK